MNDTRFTLENIEKASLCLNDSTLQAEAINLINEWSLQPTSILIALQLIQNSSNAIACFISSSIIKNKIVMYWNQMDMKQKSEYFGTLINLIYTKFDINENILFNLINSICNIALFEWPRNFSEFSQIFAPQNDEYSTKISLKILSAFLNEIDCNQDITDLHRNNLRQYIIDNYEDHIIILVNNFITIPELSTEILNIINQLVSWGFLKVINSEVSQIIMNQYFLNESTIEKVCELFKNQINQNKNLTLDYFIPFLDLYIKAINENNQMILTNQISLDFLCFVLLCSSFDFQAYIYLNEDDFRDDEDMKKIFDVSISKDIMHGKLVSIYQFIISNNMNPCFLSVWVNEMRNIYEELTYDIEPIHPANLFFKPFFNDITLAIFNSAFRDDEKDYESEKSEVIQKLFLIDKNAFISFLLQQEPSLNLCHSLLSISDLIDMSDSNGSIETLLERLIQYTSIDKSSDFLGTLFLLLSKLTKFFDYKNNFFSKLIEKIFESFQSNDNDLVSKASSSFLTLTKENIEMFENELVTYIGYLIDKCPFYIENIECEHLEKIFLSCSILIRYYKRKNMCTFNINENNQTDDVVDDSVQQMYERLFGPFIHILYNPGQFNQETVDKALNVVSKCCASSRSSAMDLFNLIWPPLLRLATITVPDANFPILLIETILCSIAKVQANMKYEEMKSQIDIIINLMISRGRAEDCFFRYFSMMRLAFKEIDDMYPIIHQQLVIPFISNCNPPSFELFKMIDKFNIEFIDIDWLSVMIIETIKQMSTDVVSLSIDVFKRKLKKCTEEQIIGFLNNISAQLISILIESIINLVHKSLLPNFVNLLVYIIFKMTKRANLIEKERKKIDVIFKNIIVSSLKEFAEEMQPGFFANFVEHLYAQGTDADFVQIFTDLLIILKRSSPCDIQKIMKNKKKNEDDDLDNDFELLIEDKNCEENAKTESDSYDEYW